MPPPYLSSKDIDGLMKTMPLYVYFSKTEWPNIRKAENDNDEGKKLLDHYSKIYKENFLKQTQSDKKILFNDTSNKQPTRAQNPNKNVNNNIDNDIDFTNKKMSKIIFGRKIFLVKKNRSFFFRPKILIFFR